MFSRSRRRQRVRLVTLPLILLSRTIGRMASGQVGFTLPWGMWVDAEQRCWLHPDYPVSRESKGTQEMRVELRADGYHVWAPPGRTWTPQREPGYFSPADTRYIPVTEVHH